jgi:L-2,4-diaminobutyrate decarboxylase
MVVRMLRTEAALPNGADGVFTAGGSQSNYLALLLARDACIESRLGWNAKTRGLPQDAHRLRILCSEEAHFTVEKSAVQLGLGTDSVIRVGVDDGFRMRPDDLSRKLAKLQSQNLIPMAVVATAGTTDFGSIDPLPEIAELARAAGTWLHIDGAYGGALLFSGRHRGLLRGIELADSFSIDFHKLLWQPISCAALLLRDARQFRFLEMHSDYLNPESHQEQGIPDLVTKSVLTSRRFDTLKVWMTFQMLGREKLGAMIDRTVELAQYAAKTVREINNLELLHDPQLSCVVFRYLPCNVGANANALNTTIRRSLFDEGRAVIGHTRVHGKQCLKLTILNPCVTEQMISDLLNEIQRTGASAEMKSRQRSGHND